MNYDEIPDDSAVWVAPSREWKGKPLEPFTERMRLLLTQCQDPEDTTAMFAARLVFLLLEYKRDPKGTTRLVWNREAFQAAFMDFLGTWEAGDIEKAMTLAREVLEEAQSGQVEPLASEAPNADPQFPPAEPLA